MTDGEDAALAETAPTPQAGGAPGGAPSRTRTLRLDLEYDGTDFHGWQVQPGLRTVQGTLEEALAKILREQVRVTGAGRTDAGVHALGQVASFDTTRAIPLHGVLRALAQELPHDVAALRVAEAPPGWSARHRAIGKHYRYRLLESSAPRPLERRYAHRLIRPLDVPRMRSAAAALAGTHDFRSFADSHDPRPTVRTIAAVDVTREGHVVMIDVRGDGFLHKMVRTLAGTLVEVGLGRRPPASLAQVLAARSRPAAGPTLPPEGLFMVSVTY